MNNNGTLQVTDGNDAWKVYLLDDGTLDTVVRVVRISDGTVWVVRFNPDDRPMPMTRAYLKELGDEAVEDFYMQDLEPAAGSR